MSTNQHRKAKPLKVKSIDELKQERPDLSDELKKRQKKGVKPTFCTRLS